MTGALLRAGLLAVHPAAAGRSTSPSPCRSGPLRRSRRPSRPRPTRWRADPPATRPTGTSCSRSGGTADAGRHRLPVLARRARRGPGARAAAWPGRCAGSATTWRARPGRRRRRPVPDVRDPGRAVRVAVPYNGSVARVDVRPRSARAGAALAGREPVRRAAPARADDAEPVGDRPAGRATGPIVATFHTATERSRALSALRRDAAAAAGEGHRADRGVRRSRDACRWSTWAGTRWRSPTASTCRRSPSGPLLARPARGRRTVGFLGRFDEPRKGMPVLLDALRDARPGRPDLRLLVVGPGRRAAVLARAARTGGRPARRARPRRRRDQGRGAALGATCSARPTPAARASAWCSPRRWPPGRRCSPATSTRSARCSTTAGGRAVPAGTRRRSRGRWRCWTTPRGARRWRGRLGARRRASTGRRSPAGRQVYETVCRRRPYRRRGRARSGARPVRPASRDGAATGG